MERILSGIVGLLMVLATLGCITPREGVSPQPTTMPQTTSIFSEANLLSIAAEKPEVEAFLSENRNYTYKVTVLTPENLTALAGKYPVVYGSLPEKTLYQIDYSYGNRGLLVIVDADEGTVIKYFRAVGIRLT